MRSPVAQLSDALLSGSYKAAWAVVRGLPEPVARRLFDAAADLSVARGGKGVERLRSNLARVSPGEDLTRAAMRSYARYWCEVFRLPSIPVSRVLDNTEVENGDLFHDAVAAPEGVVIALPHLGNWDAAAVWCIASGAPFATVAERLKPESLFDQFVAFRQSLGMEVLALTGGEQPPYEILSDRLRAGGAICLLADRDLTPRGVDVSFFGATSRMPAGPARLALDTGSRLLPVTLSFTPTGWRVAFHPVVEHTDVPTMTQGLAAAFEDGIRSHPADWHMLQRVWLDDLAHDDPRRLPVG